MPAYNLCKLADRKRYEQDLLEELQALHEGRWPRDLNDDLRYNNGPRNKTRKEFAISCLESGLEWLHSLKERLAQNEPSLENWER